VVAPFIPSLIFQLAGASDPGLLKRSEHFALLKNFKPFLLQPQFLLSFSTFSFFGYESF